MQTLEKEIIVSKDDLDQLQHVNNVRYVQWVQDVAGAQWLKNATEDILQNFYWVLVNHNIDYQGQAFLGDKILIKTYVESSKGVFSIRKVEMFNQTSEKLIISSTTKWCLINSINHKPARIPEHIATLFD